MYKHPILPKKEYFVTISRMRTSLIFLIGILLPIALGDLVDDTCKSSPLPSVCLAVLRADPKSATADVTGLALIVVEAIESKSKSTLDEINKLIGNNPELKDPLRKCTEYYNAILTADIEQAKEALTKGDPKFAESGITDVAVEAKSCEDEFAPSKSLLTDSNNAIHDLSVVGEAIIKTLL